MRRKTSFVLVLVLALFGCATKPDYHLHAFYESKNENLHLISKLQIWKSGNYTVCTVDSGHEAESVAEGNYTCLFGTWKQQKNVVTLNVNTEQDRPIGILPNTEILGPLENYINLANPETLYINDRSGRSMSHYLKTGKDSTTVNNWTNYRRIKSP